MFSNSTYLAMQYGISQESKMASKQLPYGPDPLQEARKHMAELAKRPPISPEKCGGLIRDPAIERFGWIRENSDQFFRFKPRTVFYSVMVALVVPGALYFGLKKMQRDADIKAGRPPRDFL